MPIARANRAARAPAAAGPTGLTGLTIGRIDVTVIAQPPRQNSPAPKPEDTGFASRHYLRRT
jgi:hypothetical protein